MDDSVVNACGEFGNQELQLIEELRTRLKDDFGVGEGRLVHRELEQFEQDLAILVIRFKRIHDIAYALAKVDGCDWLPEQLLEDVEDFEKTLPVQVDAVVGGEE